MERSLLAPLPDDVVLAVLACLPRREVLRCRLVCRRLRDLCLHPDLWRRVRLDWDKDCGLMRAALRSAPFLEEVTLRPGGLKELARMLPDIQCVVAKLSMVVECQDSVNAAAHLGLKLCALGGLKGIGVTVRECPAQDLTPLVRMVLSARHLRELDVFAFEAQLPASAAWSDLEGTASLTNLGFMSTSDDTSFLQFLLTTHAATLQIVFVGNLPYRLPIPASTGLPRLRSLTCSLRSLPADLQLLLQLDSFCVLGRSPPVFPSEVLDVLRQAPHLRSVLLPVPRGSPSAPLAALTQSRSARVLEQIRLNGAPDLVQLAAALPLFPSLQLLDTGVQASDAFLRAVSPASAPSLTCLRVWRPEGSCTHEWLHQPVVVDLLARNPRLHLRQERPGSAPVGCECQWCRRACHPELTGSANSRSAYALHRRTPGCPRDCLPLHLLDLPRKRPKTQSPSVVP